MAGSDSRNRLTRKAFRAWLKAKPADEIVGVAKSPGACPLACYLSDSPTDPWVAVWPSTFPGDGYVERDSGTSKLPPWANEFAIAVDRYDGSHLYRMSASEALGLLDKAGSAKDGAS